MAGIVLGVAISMAAVWGAHTLRRRSAERRRAEERRLTRERHERIWQERIERRRRSETG